MDKNGANEMEAACPKAGHTVLVSEPHLSAHLRRFSVQTSIWVRLSEVVTGPSSNLMALLNPKS